LANFQKLKLSTKLLKSFETSVDVCEIPRKCISSPQMNSSDVQFHDEIRNSLSRFFIVFLDVFNFSEQDSIENFGVLLFPLPGESKLFFRDRFRRIELGRTGRLPFKPQVKLLDLLEIVLETTLFYGQKKKRRQEQAMRLFQFCYIFMNHKTERELIHFP
jgi:hypothetical protein